MAMTHEAFDRRPAPRRSELTAPFWDAALRRVLVRQRCDSCLRSFFVPRAACPHCLSEQWTWTPSSGLGHVHSFTVCHRAPEPGFPVPYVIAIVDLEEDWSMLSNIVGVDHGALHGGMPVRVTWMELADTAVLPVFTARDGR